MKATIDKAGRVVIPAPLRARARLEPGMSLQVEVREDAILLRPYREPARVEEHGGKPVIVFASDAPSLSGDSLIEVIRDERERQSGRSLS